MKTLLVHYTPRNERSNTKKLIDAFRLEIKNSEIEDLNLSKDIPDFFLEGNLDAYIQRNYLKQDLTQEQKNQLPRWIE